MKSQFVVYDSDRIPGVKGFGPNSNVTAADIRANKGKCWLKDTNTTHPQIKTLQEFLNHLVYDNMFTDKGRLTIDGIYGEKTEWFVTSFQKYSGQKIGEATLAVDGKVGVDTLTVIERCMEKRIS